MPRQERLHVLCEQVCQSKMIMSERIEEFSTVRDQLATLEIRSIVIDITRKK